MKTLLKTTLTLTAIGVAVKVIKENKELNLKVKNQNGRIILMEEKNSKLNLKIDAISSTVTTHNDYLKTK